MRVYLIRLSTRSTCGILSRRYWADFEQRTRNQRFQSGSCSQESNLEAIRAPSFPVLKRARVIDASCSTRWYNPQNDILRRHMRPIWERQGTQATDGPAELLTLAQAEVDAVAPLRGALFAAQTRGIDTEPVTTIMDAAEVDLAVGCGIARVGYFKQAYALWRSWFEQVMFSLYFLEAPLHRSAWRVVEEIEFGKGPAARLMLHQLLADSSEKHPFLIVYDERFRALFAALHVTAPPKNDGPLKHAERCLTDLSQGVHGTFNPRPISAPADLPAALAKHALPVLQRAEATAAFFCFAFVHALLGPNDQQLMAVRQADFKPEDDDQALVRAMVPGLERWLRMLSDAQTKGKQQRG